MELTVGEGGAWDRTEAAQERGAPGHALAVREGGEEVAQWAWVHKP